MTSITLAPDRPRAELTALLEGGLAFAFPLVFLFFGPSLPALAGLYAGLLGLHLLLHNPQILSPANLAAGGLIGLLESIYRVRADGDSLLFLIITPVIYATAVVGIDVASRSVKMLSFYIRGHVLVVMLIIAQRFAGGHFASTSYEFVSSRAVGPGLPDPNVFAMTHLALLLPALFAPRLQPSDKALLTFLLMAVPGYSLSRAATLVIVFLVLVGLPRSVTVSLGVRAAVVAIASCAALMFFLQQDADSARLSAADSAGARFRYASDSLPGTLSRLGIFGVADAEHMKVVGSGHFPAPSFHNTYLSILASSGLLGLASLIALQVAVLRRFTSSAAWSVFIILNALWISTGALIGVGMAAAVVLRGNNEL